MGLRPSLSRRRARPLTHRFGRYSVRTRWWCTLRYSSSFSQSLGGTLVYRIGWSSAVRIVARVWGPKRSSALLQFHPVFGRRYLVVTGRGTASSQRASPSAPPSALTPVAGHLLPVAGARRATPRRIHGVRLAMAAT